MSHTDGCPVEADGAVDAQNAPTAPWKTPARFPRASTGPFPSDHPRKTKKGPKTGLGNPDRPELRRLDNPTFVDNEGDVVWIQEYLRLRVNGAGHSNAANQVFAQIRGASVTPTSLRTDRHGVWTDGERRVER